MNSPLLVFGLVLLAYFVFMPVHARLENSKWKWPTVASLGIVGVALMVWVSASGSYVRDGNENWFLVLGIGAFFLFGAAAIASPWTYKRKAKNDPEKREINRL